MISTFLKPMLPSLSTDLPKGENWVYEVKYDGFRCLLYWDESSIIMTSRNGHNLHTIFPEIPNRLKHFEGDIKHLFPLLIDGELCILESPFKASFEQIQKRGRLKQSDKIKQASELFPSSYCAFDLLAMEGKYIYQQPFLERKEKLQHLLQMLEVSVNEVSLTSRMNYVPFTSDIIMLKKTVQTYKSEGIVAKDISNKWSPGVRANKWIKVKNLIINTFFVLGYDTENGFFHVGVIKDHTIFSTGLFSHGISPEEKEALIQIVKKNQNGKSGSLILIEPSICVDISYLELYKNQLRQPRFVSFRFDVNWEECTWESLQKNN
ncbi:RNA ligase family protein [Fictibacillus sp. UD]|uniref:ATP-dependent DNA ligase n=1 Tax=Fictibacillus sp. UD TaxID=3038777 RepID=UPI003744C8E4